MKSPLRIFWIIPGKQDDEQGMVFVRRVIPTLSTNVDLKVHFVPNRISLISLFCNWRVAKRDLLHFRPDYVHAQYGSMLGFFAWSLGYPLVVTFRGSDVNGDPSLPWWRRKLTYYLSLWTASRAKKVICVSRDLAEAIYPSAHIIPSPLDLDLFRPISMDEARKHLMLSFNKKVVAFAGGDRPLKRRELAKQAVELADMEFLDIRGVSPDQMPWWINAADALIFTSEREGSPNIIREALACGVPVVTVDVGDVRQWISLDEFSVIVEDSPICLGEALKRAIQSCVSRKRRIDLSAVSISEHVKKLTAIYMN